MLSESLPNPIPVKKMFIKPNPKCITNDLKNINKSNGQKKQPIPVKIPVKKT